MDFSLDIYGEINEQTVEYVADKFRENYSKGCMITVSIDSYGGYIDAAYAIAEILSAAVEDGSNVLTMNSGNVMSAATVVFLMGNARVFDPSVGGFVIHQPYTSIEGNSTELIETAISLYQTENSLVDLYSQYSDTPKEEIVRIMAEDRELTPEEIKSLGFAIILDKEE